MAECDGQHLGVVTAHVAGAAPAKDESAHVGVRAKQTVSPATRRAALRRDHERCVVPGCRNARFLDVHHVALRSEGGGHDADNLTTLCGAHHRAVHRGELVVSGSVAAGIRFRHADGSDYGQAPQPSAWRCVPKPSLPCVGWGFEKARSVERWPSPASLGMPEMNLETDRTRRAGQTDAAVRPCLTHARDERSKSVRCPDPYGGDGDAEFTCIGRAVVARCHGVTCRAKVRSPCPSDENGCSALTRP